MTDRDEDKTSAVTELGTVSVDTQGAMGDMIEAMGLWRHMGISDD